MKSISTLFKMISVVLVISLLLCACGITPNTNNNSNNGGNNGGGGTTSTPNGSTAVRPENKYNPPAKLISEKDYINRVEKLCATKTFTEVDDNFLNDVDDLGNGLRDMITYNKDEIKVTGTKYYVSNTGNDKNDGRTPKTAWATLDKVATADLKEGDAVLFNRGDYFRGQIYTKSGVTYSAYGEGPKPQISYSYDGLTYGKWVKTDKPNVWRLDRPIPNEDIGLIVFNLGESYAEKKMSMDELKVNFDFIHYNSNRKDKGKFDNRIYMYCDKGNPAELFWEMELSRPNWVIKISARQKNITIHNLEIRCGDMGFFPDYSSNIKTSYCTFAWTGGVYKPSWDCRMGGGSGCWHSCDSMIFEYCYFYQQFDSGVTPQYDWTDKDPCVFKDFKTTACLFEYCEYPFEYFLTQKTSEGEKYVNTYFGYNFVRYTGLGIGDKPTQSACIKSWSAPNYQENFLIEKNIFDRPYVRALDMGAKNYDGKLDFDCLPEMNNNVYISTKNRSAIRLNEKSFRFNEEGYKQLAKLGFEKNAVFLYCKKK